MVEARFDKPPYTRHIADLVIQNYGPSLARNVHVTFNPDLQGLRQLKDIVAAIRRLNPGQHPNS